MAVVQMKLNQPQNHNRGSISSNDTILDNNNNHPSIIANVFADNRTDNNIANNNLSPLVTSRPATLNCNSEVAGSSRQQSKTPSLLDINNNTTSRNQQDNSNQSQLMSIDMPMRRLKKMGWYWGSISPDYAAKLLEDEQDGSFLVRDSSSECYIFSMTFKLEGKIHHSRIEHCKGQFSFFGRSPKFRCTTIVDFIEQAIAFSHNEELLFFLHREPWLEGPARFRMIPLSRLKSTSSLKHMCRFAILPYVRRDRISELSLPESLEEYLYEPFCHET